MEKLKQKNQILLFIVLVFLTYQHSYAFDWDRICEFLDSEEKVFLQSEQDSVYLSRLSQKVSGNTNLNFSTKSRVTIPTSHLDKNNADNLSIELWNAKTSKWKKAVIKIKTSSGVKENIVLSFEKEGLYRLKGVQSAGNFAYLLVIDDVSKSLRRYLAIMKRDVELNPDPELYRSAILVSKINGLFQKLKPDLKLNYFKKLSRVFQEFRGLKKGQCPELTPGLYKFQVRRFPGSNVVEYVLRVPEGYDAKTKSLLVFTPDIARFDRGQNYSKFSDSIALWCHSDTSKIFFKEEFEYLFAIMREKLNIDSNKIHIVGRCRNGVEAVGLALQYPDLWAGCYATLGNNNRELAINAFNMHVKFSNASAHQGIANDFGYFNFMAKCFEYGSCSKSDINIKGKTIDTSVIKRDYIKNESPSYIQYRTDCLKRGKAYWISIDGRNDENLYADIKAKVVGNCVYVYTNNVESYTIWLDRSPVRGTQISIIETNNLQDSMEDEPNLNMIRRYDCDLNSSIVSAKSDTMLADITKQKVFKRYPKNHLKSKYLKSAKLSGGINDVFAQRYVVVCPHIKDKKNPYAQFAQNLAFGAPCYADFETARESFNTHNLVFVGTFKDYSDLPKKIQKILPYKIDGKKINIDDENYSGDQGVFSVYPNPLNPERYLGVYICNSKTAALQFPDAFMKLKYKPEIDIGVYRLKQNGQFEWQFAEKFDATWNFHDRYNEIVANVGEFQGWRWKAWRADVIRKQIKADVGVFENCFNQPGNLPVGTLEKRDILRFFKNIWIVKVEIKGRELKKMLTLSFMNKDKRQFTPEISGVTFVKGGKDGQLWIGEIKDDESYTLACPQKCLNGTRIGFCPKNYKIVDDGFAVELILEYLTDMQNVNLDEELAEQKAKIL